MLRIRNASNNDLNRIMEIYKYAQQFMIRSGNPNQWGHSYPDSELIHSDIQKGVCKVICDEMGVHGVFALFEGVEPTYQQIEDGEWLNDDPYVTIHRMAGDGKVHGLFEFAVDACKRSFSNIRIDTHANNKIMLRQIEKNGFQRCGIIYVRGGSPRLAYQWIASEPLEEKCSRSH